MSEDLQRDTTITIELLKYEPELFTASPLSSDKNFILANIQSIPQIALHMNPKLKTDPEFINELCEAASPEIAKQILEDTNLSKMAMSDKIEVAEDMVNAAVVASIVADVSNMSLLTHEQRNDYNLLKDIAYQNEEAVGYVINNINEFGAEGIAGVNKAVQEHIVEESIPKIMDIKETSPIHNIDELIDFNNPDVEKDPRLAAKVGAVLSLSGEEMTDDRARRIVEAATLAAERAKADPDWIHKDPDAYKSFMAPTIVQEALEYMRQKGLPIPEKAEEILGSYEQTQQEAMGPDNPWSQEYMDKENAFYEEQEQRLLREAEEAGIPPEEYIPAHAMLYEDYLEMQKSQERVDVEAVKEATSELPASEINEVTTEIKEDAVRETEQPKEKTEQEPVQSQDPDQEPQPKDPDTPTTEAKQEGNEGESR